MDWSTDELSKMRVLVANLFDDIGLTSYVFNIEQDQNDWVVSADYPHDGQWQTVDLRVEKGLLRDCFIHEKSRENLKFAWKVKLDNLS